MVSGPSCYFTNQLLLLGLHHYFPKRYLLQILQLVQMKLLDQRRMLHALLFPHVCAILSDRACSDRSV